MAQRVKAVSEMTTAEAVAGITDAGEFEILATRVLKQTRPDCAHLDHFGVNAQGKTIPAALDGFAKITECNPSKYVMACFTTSSTLRDKWLLDTAQTNRKGLTHANDGDLVKARRLADTLRENESTATFKVYLCVNTQPTGDEVQAALQYGLQHSLQVDFLTQSMIRDHLDTSPSGQYLRKQHLGIESTLLSTELLRDICKESTERYEASLLRPVDNHVGAQLESVQKLDALNALTFLVSSSGHGKSSICTLLMKRQLEREQFSLWIPGDVVAECQSLADAISKVLRSYRPSLESEPSQLVARNTPLLLIVDDLNRTGKPAELAGKLMGWCSTTKANANLNWHGLPLRVVAPLWDSVLGQLPGFNSEREIAKVVALHKVEEWGEEDAISFLSRRLPAADDRNNATILKLAVEKCACDPLLLSSLASVANDDRRTTLDALADHVLDRFVEAELRKTESSAHTAGELRAALVSLAERMVLQRSFSVPWKELRQSFKGELRQLCQHRSLCQLAGTLDDERVEFKHDRLLEFFAVLAMEKMTDDYQANPETISDPYFASFAAQALLKSQKDLPLEWIIRESPLVLVEALKHLQLSDPRSASIISKAKEWFAAKPTEGSKLEYEYWLAAGVLLKMNSSLVLDVTEQQRSSRIFRLARLANGDFEAGIKDLGGRNGFDIGTRYLERTEAIRQAVNLHRAVMTDGCLRVLRSDAVNPDEFHGALALSGFLCDANLLPEVLSSWKKIANKEEFLELVLWAALRCLHPSQEEFLKPLIDAWLQLPEELVEDRVHRSPRNEIGTHLGWAMQYGLSNHAVSFLISLAEEKPELSFPISLVLRRLHTREAVLFVVKETAASMQNGHGMWGLGLWGQWDGGDPLPELLKLEIKQLAFDRTAEPWLSAGALEVWIRITKDIDQLKEVGEGEGDKAFSSAVWHRLHLGDTTAVEAGRRLYGDRWHYWDLMSRAWSSELEDEFDQALQRAAQAISENSADSHDHLSHCLRDMDRGTSEKFLEKHWDGLRQHRTYLQAALYVGTPSLLDLVSKEISSMEKPDTAFEHIKFFYGFSQQGLSEKLEPRHFHALEPYVQFIDSMELSDLARAARNIGMTDWPDKVIGPVVQERRLRYTDDTKQIDLLERFAGYEVKTDAELIEQLRKLKGLPDRELSIKTYIWYSRSKDHVIVDSNRLLRILGRWLDEDADIEALRVAVHLVSERGTRQDLSVLRCRNDLLGWTDQATDLYGRAFVAVCRRRLD